MRPITPASAVPVQAAPAQAAPAQVGSLPLEVQEQLFGILRASLDVSLLPLLEKQNELEERLESLQDPGSHTGVGFPSGLPPQQRSLAASVPAMPPMRAVAPSLSVDVSVDSKAPPATVTSTSYGLVITPSVAPRPAIDLEKVEPFEMPDFGNSRRNAGTILVALLLAGLAAAIAATVLSYN